MAHACSFSVCVSVLSPLPSSSPLSSFVSPFPSSSRLLGCSKVRPEPLSMRSDQHSTQPGKGEFLACGQRTPGHLKPRNPAWRECGKWASGLQLKYEVAYFVTVLRFHPFPISASAYLSWCHHGLPLPGRGDISGILALFCPPSHRIRGNPRNLETCLPLSIAHPSKSQWP